MDSSERERERNDDKSGNEPWNRILGQFVNQYKPHANRVTSALDGNQGVVWNTSICSLRTFRRATCELHLQN